jgi:hypothetical protein
MSIAPRHLAPILLLLLSLGCGGDPSGPSGGSLAVTIQGLPAGSAAAVFVSGPDGFDQALSSSQTLTALSPGSYTITATGVTVAGTTYQASPGTQTIAVVRSNQPSNASVTYATATGDLSLTVSGLGTSGAAVVTVTGPNSYNRSVTGSTTLHGLAPGTYTVAAQSVTASCGSTYTASPPSQNVNVASSGLAHATVAYSSAASGSVANLCIDGMYLIQSAQTYAGTIPLVRNRDGLLRVFVVSDRPNTPASTVQVQLRIYPPLGAPTVVTLLSPPGLVSVPTAPDESSLNNSWNYSVAGSTIQPGFSIEAEVDAGSMVAESDESDNVFTPAAAPTVRTIPTLNVTFVPIVQSGGQPGNVTDANKAAFLDATRKMYPIDGVNALVRSTPITTTTTLQSDGTGWQTVLDQVDAIAVADGTRYYYGVAKVSYSSGVAGVAYVSTPSNPQRAAMGWDYLNNGTGSLVAAHELGHNWGRNHAPCGGPTGIDPSFPNVDGTTGEYGYDVATSQLAPPTSTDIMGYCDPKWISSYTYSAALNYLTSTPLLQGTSFAGQAIQPSLLVWGNIRDGQLTLNPAFQINTRPRLPGRAGPYTIEGRAADGSTLFTQSFSPSEVADLPGSHQSFAFAVPLSSAQAARLTSIHLRGHGQETVRSTHRAGPGATTQAAGLRRVAPGRVSLEWDHRTYPMVMVRNSETGEVMSLAEGGRIELPTSRGQVDLVLSDGVRSVVKRVVAR